jgi:hypothetical protein
MGRIYQDLHQHWTILEGRQMWGIPTKGLDWSIVHAERPKYAMNVQREARVEEVVNMGSRTIHGGLNTLGEVEWCTERADLACQVVCYQ